MTQIQLGNIVVDVVKKDIKNIHLSVYPPKGRVRISAPERMNNETIRIFAISKISWIKQQQKKYCRRLVRRHEIMLIGKAITSKTSGIC